METEHPTQYKIRINERVPMSQAAFLTWGVEQRKYIAKHMFTYQTRLCTSVPFDVLRTDENIGVWMCQYFSNGVYYLMGYSHGKTITHRKLVALARIDIYDSENCKFKITTTIKGRNRLSRYWFRKSNLTKTLDS